MPQLRQDPATHEWTIVAAERAKRPDQFRVGREKRPAPPSYSPTCPFCPGNEKMTPPEIYSLPADKASGGPPWKIRVIPNKFAALVPEGSLERRVEADFFRNMDGFGYHEVIVQTPHHDKPLALLSREEVTDLILTCRRRYLELRKMPGIEAIIIFENHGPSAGTSLEHPHSQIVAIPVVPNRMRDRYESAIQYYDDLHHCVYCDMLEKETQIGTRIVEWGQGFVVLNPYASTAPFETWILPTRCEPSFGNITDEECSELAAVLRKTLRKLYFGLNNPDYNLVLNTALVGEENKHYYVWHIQIIPRLTTRAGFEIGSGVYITTALPEETAKFLREFNEESPVESTQPAAGHQPL